MRIKIIFLQSNKLIPASFAFLFLMLIIAGCHTVKSSRNNGDNKDSKTIHLFNGKNLNGWYTFLKDRGRDIDPKKVFTVADGLIRISGEEWGCITTHEEFSNYKLVFEIKWGSQTFSPRINNAMDMAFFCILRE